MIKVIFISTYTFALLFFAWEKSVAMDVVKLETSVKTPQIVVPKKRLDRKAKMVPAKQTACNREEEEREAAWADTADKLFADGKYQEASEYYIKATKTRSRRLTTHSQCVYALCQCYLLLLREADDLVKKEEYLEKAERVFNKFQKIKNKDKDLSEFDLLNEFALGIAQIAEKQFDSDIFASFVFYRKWFTTIYEHRKLFSDDNFFLGIVNDIKYLVKECYDQLKSNGEANNLVEMLQFLDTIEKVRIAQPVLAQAVALYDDKMPVVLEDYRLHMNREFGEAPQPLVYVGEPDEWLDGDANKRRKLFDNN